MNTIDYKRRANKIKPKTTLRFEINKTIKALVVTLSLMILALGIIFLVSTNEGAQKGYALEQAKLKNEQLMTEKDNLITKITNSTSFNNIENSDKLKKMEETQNKKYITPEDNMVK